MPQEESASAVQEEDAPVVPQEDTPAAQEERAPDDMQDVVPEAPAVPVWTETTFIENDRVDFAGTADTAGAQNPAGMPTETPAAARTVRITTSCDTDTLRLGSRITLTAHLEGYDGAAYIFQWQYAAADSEGNIISQWQDAQETDLTFSYILTEDNILTAWRMRVIVTE